MRNRSQLPSFFASAPLMLLDNSTGVSYPLEVFDITYLHFHSLMELGVCTSGRGSCIVEGMEYAFQEGDVQIVFPFQRHLSRSEGGEFSRWYWTNINPLQLMSLYGAPHLPRLEKLLYTQMGLCGIIDRRRYPLAAELIARVTLPGPQQRRLACLYALIEELAAESEGLKHLELRPGRAFMRLEPALALVEAELDAGRTPAVSALAQACAMSAAALRRSFHQALGQSPQQYIQTCQMRRAQHRLLLTNDSVTEIALSVGYQDVSGFNRLFLRTFGMPPLRYRLSGGEEKPLSCK